MSISEHSYKRARAILVQAGSKSAGKGHDPHGGGGGVPEQWGRNLLREAQDEFGTNMTQAQADALRRAAKEMGITEW
ncbi:MAG: hypothetical protein A4E65_03040 [Syntrophorhabdus sp. PtaU1.Bin153]|nr:MAG: hypothetical protein A4E65_03040 [Syntrophorhabdus sp. PtaU1.Bin153]